MSAYVLKAYESVVLTAVPTHHVRIMHTSQSMTQGQILIVVGSGGFVAFLLGTSPFGSRDVTSEECILSTRHLPIPKTWSCGPLLLRCAEYRRC